MSRTIKVAAKRGHGKRRAVVLDEGRLQAIEKAARKLARPSAASLSFEQLEAKSAAARAQFRRR